MLSSKLKSYGTPIYPEDTREALSPLATRSNEFCFLDASYEKLTNSKDILGRIIPTSRNKSGSDSILVTNLSFGPYTIGTLIR